MADVIPIHKGEDKQNVENYRPVSLFPSFEQIFERPIYNKMYLLCIENDLISLNQSGFKQGDSCINQLLSITHDIYQSLDQGYQVSGAFLDISKGFDKFWQKGLIHKSEQNGIGGPPLKISTDLLKSRKQRVVPYHQQSSWRDVLASVPQGSILGPLLFLIYINDDLYDVLECNPKLFVDDTLLFATVHNINKATNDLNNDLTKITKWADEVIFSRKRFTASHPPLTFNNIPVAQTNSQKTFGSAA